VSSAATQHLSVRSFCFQESTFPFSSTLSCHIYPLPPHSRAPHPALSTTMSYNHVRRSCVIPDRPVSLACPPPSSSSHPIAFVASRSGIWRINLSDNEWVPTSFPSSSNTHAAAGAVAVACSPHHVRQTPCTTPQIWQSITIVGRCCSAAQRSRVGVGRSNDGNACRQLHFSVL
jgi:hypothetical protein